MKSDNDLISASLVGGVACSGQLSLCHFDRNEVECRNLRFLWQRQHGGGLLTVMFTGMRKRGECPSPLYIIHI